MTRSSRFVKSPNTRDMLRSCAPRLPSRQLVADWRTALAFERIMEVLGEAVKRLPADLRARYPAVPWKLVIGMRDRVSHGYDAVDYQTLWDTVHQDFPTLVATVEQMLAEIADSHGG